MATAQEARRFLVGSALVVPGPIVFVIGLVFRHPIVAGVGFGVYLLGYLAWLPTSGDISLRLAPHASRYRRRMLEGRIARQTGRPAVIRHAVTLVRSQS